MERWVPLLQRFDFCSYLVSDPTDELLMIIGIFTHFFALETTLAERQFFRALAKLIGRRAARLSSCGIAAIVKKMGYLEEGCSVGADGSLYNVCGLFSFSCSFFSFSDKDTDCFSLNRNILGSQTGYMKGFKTSLETRAGEGIDVPWLHLWLTWCSLTHHRMTKKIGDLSNIVTHHAEDGSGVGSAIIAGQSTSFIIHERSSPQNLRFHLTFSLLIAMTKIRKDAGLYVNV